MKSDTIDHAVGVVCRRKRGGAVEAGDVLAEIHARNDASAADAAREVEFAYEIALEPGPERPVLLEVIASAAAAECGTNGPGHEEAASSNDRASDNVVASDNAVAYRERRR